MNEQRQYIEACRMLAACKFNYGLALVGTQALFGHGEDYDLLWLVTNRDAAIAFLMADGYEVESGEAYDMSSGKFKSLRKGKINVLVTDDGKWNEAMLIAGKVCKYLQVRDKETRKNLHRIIRDGADWDDVPAPVLA